MVEYHFQKVEKVLSKIIKVMDEQEETTRPEGRSQRDNLRIYNVPKGTEGSSIVEFILRESFDLFSPQEKDLRI